jgi:hypothetical protein
MVSVMMQVEVDRVAGGRFPGKVAVAEVARGDAVVEQFEVRPEFVTPPFRFSFAVCGLAEEAAERIHRRELQFEPPRVFPNGSPRRLNERPRTDSRRARPRPQEKLNNRLYDDILSEDLSFHTLLIFRN